jgi:hypothetical protein
MVMTLAVFFIVAVSVPIGMILSKDGAVLLDPILSPSFSFAVLPTSIYTLQFFLACLAVAERFKKYNAYLR